LVARLLPRRLFTNSGPSDLTPPASGIQTEEIMETGGKQTRETREKIRQATLKQWQDPAFIAFMAEVRKRPRVAPRKKQTGRPKGTPHSAETREPHAGRPRVRPLEGTPEYQWYRKVAATLGIDAARSLGLGNAT
jgi:hypothetical protein